MRKEAVILVVDSDESFADQLAAAFQNSGATVRTAHRYADAQKQIDTHTFDMVVCSTRLEKDADGLSILTAVREKSSSIPVILTSETPDINACKEALKLGAFDFLVKPLDMEEFFRVARQALPSVPMVRQNEDFTFSGIISRSQAMQAVYRKLRRIAPTDLPVLIEGESATIEFNYAFDPSSAD